MKSSRNILLVIVGPTASGKTELAIRLAQLLKTSVISADSRQFYREMNIGTAKPTEHELQLVPHFFVNSHSVKDFYSVGAFERDVLDLLNQLFNKNRIVIMAGGSGLYIRAVCQGVDDFPVVKPEIRNELNHIYQTKGLEAIQKLLSQHDPVYFKSVDLNNPQRLLRALEVCLSSNQPYSSFKTGKKAIRNFDIIKIGLQIDREILYRRIDLRVEEMMNNHFLEEAQQLYPLRNLNALQTVGYQELFDFLDGKITLDAAVSLIKQNTRRYAKRQMTWFRKEPGLIWVSPDNLDHILEIAGISF